MEECYFKLLLACNFTKSSTPPWVFFTFFKLYKWYKIAQNIVNDKNVQFPPSLYQLQEKAENFLTVKYWRNGRSAT